MNWNDVFIFLPFVWLFAVIATSWVKGYYHFEYLKTLKGSKYSSSENFGSFFTLGNWNTTLQFLVLPFFKRYKSEETEGSNHFRKRTILFLALNLLTLMPIIIPVIMSLLDGVGIWGIIISEKVVILSFG